MARNDLAELLDELRRELASEVPIVLHSRVPIAGRHTVQGSPEMTYGHVTGLPFAPGFERRLSHRDWWGINELAASSMSEVGDWCRARHQSDLHRSPGRSTSLCERIVAALADFGQPITHVAWREGLDAAVIESLALHALRHAYAWRHRRLHSYMRSATENERDRRIECPLCTDRSVRMRRRTSAA